MMNNFTVRLGGGNFANSGSSLFLRRADETELQIRHSIADFARLKRPINPLALDFVLFALAVYGCDRATSRDKENDRWTRQFYLKMPVSDPDRWNAASAVAQQMVSFLTGDEWRIEFTAQDREIFGKEFRKTKRRFRKRTIAGGSAVSLFSGGMDSLIGIIDWLENHPGERLTLSGAYDPAAEAAQADQSKLFAHLNRTYKSRLHRLTSRMGLKGAGAENSYRSRSFCFVSFGVLAAQFLDSKPELIIPENGSIALNYALTPARSGSLSTRTVHPYFLGRMRELLAAVEVQCTLINPYEFKTKGEMIEKCENKKLLKQIYADSISCGNRKRYKVHVPGATADHCGYCIPCLYRQAALHRVGWPAGDYGVRIEDSKSWGKLGLNDPSHSPGAAKDFVLRRDSKQETWRNITANGRVPLSSKAEYISLVQRQRTELEKWMVHIGFLPQVAE